MITNVVGVTFSNDDGKNRQSIISALNTLGEIYPGRRLNLEREPTNEFDKNAIAVLGPYDHKLGYIQKDLAAKLAPLMDQYHEIRAEVVELLGNGDDFTYGLRIRITDELLHINY